MALPLIWPAFSTTIDNFMVNLGHLFFFHCIKWWHLIFFCSLPNPSCLSFSLLFSFFLFHSLSLSLSSSLYLMFSLPLSPSRHLSFSHLVFFFFSPTPPLSFSLYLFFPPPFSANFTSSFSPTLLKNFYYYNSRLVLEILWVSATLTRI